MSAPANTSTAKQLAVPPQLHYSKSSRKQLAAAFKSDNPGWTANTPFEEFCQKFQLRINDTVPPETIKKLSELGESMKTESDSVKVLDVIVLWAQGTADKPDGPESALKTKEEYRKNVSMKFESKGDKLLREAPEGTRCRPDLIGYDRNRFLIPPELQPPSAGTRSNQRTPSPYVNDSEPSWSQLEVTCEYLSSQDKRDDSLAKAISYSAFHLLSRPDRIIVPGFEFGASDFTLLFTGASGVCHTKLLWTEKNHIRLLCDFVLRAFNPTAEMLDPSITRNTDNSFDVKLKERTFEKCKILALGRAIGRRTTVFRTGELDVPIIKEQYLFSPSPEARILSLLYGVPGVVRIHDHEECRTIGGEVACTVGKKPRHKIRIALKDMGESIKESKTVYQFLCRIYDLLEVAECVYQKGAIHRDFSPENVLFRDPTILDEYKQSNFCSIRHLLDPTQERQATEVLLIDFEHSTEHKEQAPLDSAGTPLYQARATVDCAPIDHDIAYMPGMPGLVPEALQLYEKIWPERLEKFPADGKKYILQAEEDDDREWYHQLRHDVESAFWMIFSWSIHLQPHDRKDIEKIPSSIGVLLVSKRDRGLLIGKVLETGPYAVDWLHSDYKALHGLVRKLATYLKADLHWVKEEHPRQMSDPSFLREVFQREILNFLVSHKKETFLRKERHHEDRPVEDSEFLGGSRTTRTQQSGRSAGVKRVREEEKTAQPPVKKTKSNAGSKANSDDEKK